MRGALLCLALLAAEPADEWLEKPVDDATFETYLDFFTIDSDLDFATEVIDVEEDEGIRRERLSFLTTPDERVPAYLFRPTTSSSTPRPALIFLHGGIRLGKEGRSAQTTAKVLARDGWNVLVPDMKHFGERDSGILTTFNEADKHEHLYNQLSLYLEWTTQTVKDVRRAFDFLVREKNSDPDAIVLAGHSRGAVVAFVAGGAEPRLAGVITFYGGHFDALEKKHIAAACPANYVTRISPRPLLMINGTHDADFIRDTSVEPLFALAREPKQIQWQDRGHGGISDADRLVMLEWLREHVKKK